MSKQIKTNAIRVEIASTETKWNNTNTCLKNTFWPGEGWLTFNFFTGDPTIFSKGGKTGFSSSATFVELNEN